jgi:hypothetical protein
MLEPFGQPRMDRIVGTQTAQFHNMHRAKGTDAKHWYDFFPNASMPESAWPDKKEKPQDVQQQNQQALVWVAGYNTRLAEHQKKEAQAKELREQFEVKAQLAAKRQRS